MAAGSLKANFILRLEDQLSGGLDKLTKMLGRFGELTRKLTLDPLTRSAERLPGVTQAVSALERAVVGVGTAAGRTEAAFERLWRRARDGAGQAWRGVRNFGQRLGPVGTAISGISLAVPLQAYGSYENILRHIAITEKKSGPAVNTEVARLTKMFAADALETGQSSESIAKAYSDLVQMGLPAHVIDTAIVAHSRAATAYNIDPEAMGPAVGALLGNMQIPEGELGPTLAAMAYASKEGRFKMSDFSLQLPGIAGVASGLKMQGRSSANVLFAALETVMKNSSEPSQAATNLGDAMRYMTSRPGISAFAKHGINLPGLIDNALKKGINPLDAVLSKVQQLTKGMSIGQAAKLFSALFHNQQAGDAVRALLQHVGEYTKLRDDLAKVDQRTVDRDYESGHDAPLIQLNLFREALTQATRSLGHGFEPALKTFNVGLLRAVKWFDELQEKHPDATAGVLTGVAGAAGLTALAGLVGMIGPAVGAGFAAIFSLPALAVGAAAATVGGVGWYVWHYWDDLSKAVETAPIFDKKAWAQWWSAEKEATQENWTWLMGYLGENKLITLLNAQIEDIKGWGKELAEQLKSNFEAIFGPYIDWVGKRIEELLKLLPHAPSSPGTGSGQISPEDKRRMDYVAPGTGALDGNTKPAAGPGESQWSVGSAIPAPPWRAPLTGEITVRLTDGLQGESTDPRLRIVQESQVHIDRGRALEREGRRDY